HDVRGFAGDFGLGELRSAEDLMGGDDRTVAQLDVGGVGEDRPAQASGETTGDVTVVVGLPEQNQVGSLFADGCGDRSRYRPRGERISGIGVENPSRSVLAERGEGSVRTFP